MRVNNSLILSRSFIFHAPSRLPQIKQLNKKYIDSMNLTIIGAYRIEVLHKVILWHIRRLSSHLMILSFCFCYSETAMRLFVEECLSLTFLMVY